MKFYESTSFFLRVIIVNYYSKILKKSIKLLPMFHIGETEYYKNMLSEADTCDLVLYEGVRLDKKRISMQIGRYTSLAEKLNLESQYHFFQNNEFKTKTVHTDLDGIDAQRAWQNLKFKEKLKYRFINPIGFYIATHNITRQKLSKAFMTGAEEANLAYGPIEEEGNLEHLTNTVRDNIVTKKISEILKSNDYDQIGVMFGAGHMKEIKKYLTQEFDFKLEDSKFAIVYHL